MNPVVEQIRDMIDAIPALAWSCRPDGTTEFHNQTWLDYTGMSREESLGWGWKAAIHPDDLDAWTASWRSSTRRATMAGAVSPGRAASSM